MENQFINRYNSFCKSLDILHQSCAADPNAMFVLGATAQAYNLTFDLSWKVMKDILIKYFGIQDFLFLQLKSKISKYYENGLLETAEKFSELN